MQYWCSLGDGLEKDFFDLTSHRRERRETVGLAVEGVHDACHVEVDALAGLGHSCWTQNLIVQLLHVDVHQPLKVGDSLGFCGFRMLQHVQGHTGHLSLT